MPLRKREIDCYLNKETVNDLIIAHLIAIGVIRYNAEVTDFYLGPSANDGVYQLRVRLEPLIQTINH